LDKAQAIARQQLSLEPWREQAYRQLMKAFALAGDRANALAQYDLCREQLWEELAVEPAPETTALYEEIKSGQVGPVLSNKPIQPPARVRHNLPADTLPFVGRELELEELTSALTEDDRRLVTVLGPGGMGKTRLAMTVGRQLLDHFADGVYFVDLAPVDHGQEVLPAVAVALSYQAPDSTQALKPQLLDYLSRRRLLLILDNFEHLLAEAGLVNEILQACPKISILVTSRQRLNLVSESLYELSGLAFDDELGPDAALSYPAVQLFVDSGRRVQPHFTLAHDNVQDVIRICQQVQGMPLGLILAANWLELLSPAEIAAEIQNSLEFLTAELSDLPERQRSMLAVFERSWASLTGDEQKVMVGLSVFRGGFSREAAEQVAGANLRVLLGLVNKSFLQRQPDSGRYAIHELLRQFAAGKRRQLDLGDEARLAHCNYYAQMMATMTRRSLYYYFPVIQVRRHMAERDNINRAWDYALEQGLATSLSDLVYGVVALGLRQGLHSGHFPGQAIQVLRQRGLPETDRVMLQMRSVELGYGVGKEQPTRVQESLLEVLPVFEEAGDPELLYWMYERLLWNSLSVPGRDHEAFEWLDKEYEAALQMGDEVFIRASELNRLWFSMGEDLPVDSPLEQLLNLRTFFEQDYSDSIIFLGILDSLCKYYSKIGEYERALYFGKLNINLAMSWQDLFWIGFTVNPVADIYISRDQWDLAASTVLEAIDWHLAIGQVWQTLGVLWGKVFDFPSLIGSAFGVSILSMVYHHPESIPYFRQGIVEARPQFEKELGAVAFAAAWETGKSLDFETAVAQVRVALGADQEL
jgi:hypothetical protein